MRNVKKVKVIRDEKLNGLYSVVVGADDPMDLQGREAEETAKKHAKRKGYSESEMIDNGEIRTFGQNKLAERRFFFRKG